MCVLPRFTHVIIAAEETEMSSHFMFVNTTKSEYVFGGRMQHDYFKVGHEDEQEALAAEWDLRTRFWSPEDKVRVEDENVVFHQPEEFSEMFENFKDATPDYNGRYTDISMLKMVCPNCNTTNPNNCDDDCDADFIPTNYKENKMDTCKRKGCNEPKLGSQFCTAHSCSVKGCNNGPRKGSVLCGPHEDQANAELEKEHDEGPAMEILTEEAQIANQKENTMPNIEAMDAQITTLTTAVAELVAKVAEQEETIERLKAVANDHHRMLHNTTQKETKKQAPTNTARAQKAGPAQKKETTSKKKQFPCKVYKCMGHTDAHHPELHMAQVNKKKEKINK